MHRPFRTRLAALAAAALLLLPGGREALAVHPCAHHGLGGEHSHAGSTAAESHHAHAPGHEPDGHPSSGTGAEHPEDGCSCPGSCAASTGVPVPDGRTVAATLLPPRPAPATPRDEARLPARLLPHLLPYAQAPPRAA